MKSEEEYCIIDCRVSDKIQLQGGSLDNQEMIGRLVAEKLDALIAKIFKKPHSATTTERDDFQDALDFIKNDPRNIKYYIVKSIDRLTREGYPEYLRLKKELEKIGVKVIDSEGIIQPERNTLEHFGGNIEYRWSMHSPSEAGEMLEAYKGKAEVRDILTRLIGAEIALVQSGYAVRRPPDGLANKHIMVDGKKKIIREPDAERAHFFQKMYELRAEGMGDLEICNRLNAMGFRTRYFNKWDRHDKEHPRVVGKTGGKLLTAKQLQRYIMQTEYAGVSSEKWNRHRPLRTQGFEGIVPIETFNKANRGKVYIRINTDQSIEVLHGYSRWGSIKRLRDNPDYPWKCILCPTCKSEMLGSASRGKSGGKFLAYHCGGAKNGKRNHPYSRVTKKELEKNVGQYLDKLKFAEGFLAGLELHLVHQYHTREKEILIQSSAISRTVADLKAELEKKLDTLDRTESATVRRMIEGQIDGLDAQIKQAENERGTIELNERSIRAFRHYAGEVMEHPSEILTEADNLYARRTLLSLFFEEAPTYQEILNGTPKLQPLFRLSEEFKTNKSQLATPRGIEPRFTP